MTSTLTSLAALTLAVFLPFAYGDSDEVSEIMASCEAQLSSPDPLELSSALEAGQRMQAFFKVVAGQIHEREYILENLQTALIGRQPVLFVGPPGNAKTRLVTYVLGNILDETTMKPSFFTDQMTFETTISDTHGSINFKALTETGKIERFLEEGVLGNFFSLLDEQFDMRPNALRNILTALADRSYKGIPGKTWMIAGASN